MVYFNKYLLGVLLFTVSSLLYGQTVNQEPICYGEPIQLECSFISGGCGAESVTYHWENYSGSWSVDYNNYSGPIYVYPSGYTYTINSFPSNYPNHLLPQVLGGTGPAGSTSTGLGYAGDFFYLSVQYPTSNFSGGRVTVVVSSGPSVSLVNMTHPFCPESTGSIDINVTSGVAPYKYFWSNGATTQDVTGLIGGTYSVTVMDSRVTESCNTDCGCSNYPFNSFTINSALPSPTFIKSINNVSCYEQCDGSAMITPSDGSSTYTYLWSTGDTTQWIVNVCAGTYSVTITDNEGCVTTENVVINTESFSISHKVYKTKCDRPNGSIIIIINTLCTNGVYTYLWNDGNTNQNRMGLAAGTYTVTVTDNNMNQVIKEIIIE